MQENGGAIDGNEDQQTIVLTERKLKVLNRRPDADHS
jgi:hypothetical protein